MLDKLHPVDQLRTVLEGCKGALGEPVDGFCRLFKVHMYVCVSVQPSFMQ